MWDDPIVAEVRRIREELSAQVNFDVRAMFADLRKHEAVLGERLKQPRRKADSSDTPESRAKRASA